MTGVRGDMAPECGGLGKRIERPAAPSAEWVATETKGIERNVKTGQLRTNPPDNEFAHFAPFHPSANPFF